MVQTTQVVAPASQDFGSALMTSLTAALATLAAALPRVIAFLVILGIGWFLASLLARAVAALLATINFNRLSDRAGFSTFVRHMGSQRDPITIVAITTRWAIRLLALVVAFNALGLTAVSGVLQRLLLWVPNLIVAVVVLIVGGLAGNGLGKVVRGATARAGFHTPELMGTVTRVAVVGFSIVVAIDQLQIAPRVVMALVFGVVGASSLALGLAFGLGGREKAERILSGLEQRAREARPKLQKAATEIDRRARIGFGADPQREE